MEIGKNCYEGFKIILLSKFYIKALLSHNTLIEQSTTLIEHQAKIKPILLDMCTTTLTIVPNILPCTNHFRQNNIYAFLNVTI